MYNLELAFYFTQHVVLAQDYNSAAWLQFFAVITTT